MKRIKALRLTAVNILVAACLHTVPRRKMPVAHNITVQAQNHKFTVDS